MRPRPALTPWAVVLFALGCSVFNDTSDLGGGTREGGIDGAGGDGSGGYGGTAGWPGTGGVGGYDAGNCPPGKKACGTGCASIDDPNTGCATASCAPCGLAHASALCVAGACAIGQCENGHDDCNSTASDGCEADLKTDALHCSSCAKSCSLPHAQQTCGDGVCSYVGCDTGFVDCNSTLTDGCEIDTANDPAHCGDCATACTAPAGKSPTCSAGQCGVSDCLAPLADCDASGDCETDTSSSSSSCGYCGHACGYTNGVAVCSGGTCALGGCNAGFGNCNQTDVDGCELDVTTVQACGTCTNSCADAANGTALCSNGACALSCAGGYGDCYGGVADGCETYLNSDANCRACGVSIGASGGGGGPLPRVLRSVTASGSTLSFQSCSFYCDAYAGCYDSNCAQVDITLGGATASGSAGQPPPWELRSVTASGNVLTFQSCIGYCDGYGSCYDASCVPGDIVLSGATASGSAGQAHPYELRSLLASGNAITFQSCTGYCDAYGTCTDTSCVPGSIVLACGP